jgi:hypothetical protein
MDLPFISIQREWARGLFKIDQSHSNTGDFPEFAPHHEFIIAHSLRNFELCWACPLPGETSNQEKEQRSLRSKSNWEDHNVTGTTLRESQLDVDGIRK